MSAIMRIMRNTFLLLTVLMTPVQAKKPVCHLHIPVDLDAYRHLPAIMPDLGDRADCERENARRLDAMGRCHCSFAGAGFQQYLPSEGRPAGARPAWLE